MTKVSMATGRSGKSGPFVMPTVTERGVDPAKGLAQTRNQRGPDATARVKTKRRKIAKTNAMNVSLQ